MDLIRLGHHHKGVADLQTRLEKLGYKIDPPELGGTFGPATEMAVKEFQQKADLDVDGLVGEATWRALVESSWTLGDRPLRLGQPFLRGDDVRELQARLNALGFAAGKHDGIFGLGTAAAVRSFQRNLALTQDGIFGHETFRAMERLQMVIKRGIGARVIEREARRAHLPGLRDKKVALDPGHGGADPGDRGPDGQTEAEWTFGLAARLALLLDARQAHAMLTRGPNDGPHVSQRAQLANRFGADLLLSIHLNAHSTPVAAGAATYYFQGGTVASEPGEHLAELIRQALIRAGRPDCGTHGKAYPILRETQMPAVVVEPGFITNPQELGELDATLDDIAEAMAQALESYFALDPE